MGAWVALAAVRTRVLGGPIFTSSENTSVASFFMRAGPADRIDATIPSGCVCRIFPCSGSQCLPSCRDRAAPINVNGPASPCWVGQLAPSDPTGDDPGPWGRPRIGISRKLVSPLANLTVVCVYVPGPVGWRAHRRRQLKPGKCSEEAKILKIFVDAQGASLSVSAQKGNPESECQQALCSNEAHFSGLRSL